MKTSMKLMVMTLVVAMLLSMSAFAASVSYTSLVPTVNEAGTDYSVVVNYAAADYATGDQITMLVLKDSAEITWVEGSNDTIPANVIYIDQETIEGATGSFTFTIAKSEVDGRNVYVKLGATSQAEAKEGTYTEFVKTEGGDTVEVTVDNSVANAFGETGLAMISVKPDVALADGKIMTVNGAEMFYTLYNGVKKYVALLKDYNAETAVFAIKDGTATKVVFGDVNTTDGAESVTGADVSDLTAIAVGKTVLSTDFAKLVADINGDGAANGADVSEATAIAVGKQTYPTAAGVVAE